MTERRFDNVGERLYEQELNNGLRVLVLPKPGFSRSFAMFATEYGSAMSRFELDGRKIETPAGVAHFLEHKMFDMPEGNALEALSALGASPNAFTSHGMTAYYFECGERFDEAFDTLLRFVSTPFFSEESVQKEQGIIGQEIGMSDDDPGSRVYDELMASLYATHPIRGNILGTASSIAQISARTLYDCHSAFYAPSNMVLAVIGDVDPEKIARAAESILPGERKPRPLPDYGESERPEPLRERIEVKMDVSAPIAYLGAKLGGAIEGKAGLKQRILASLALRYLAGRGSRLYNELYSAGLIRTGLSMSASWEAGVGYAMLGAECREPEALLDGLKGELLRAQREGLDEVKFMRCLRGTYGASLRQLEDFMDMGYALVTSCMGGYCELDAYELLAGLKAEDCAEYIVRTLRPDCLSMAVVRPVGA